MIALVDDLNEKKVSKKSKKTDSKKVATLRQALVKLWTNHQKRKADNKALHQLMQLDDALLKDMGLSRDVLVSIQNGSSTFDSLVKRTILSDRDQACSTTPLRK